MNSYLVIRFGAMGDVAMSVPVIYSVAWKYPNARFTVLTKAFFTQIFVNKPDNVKVIALDTRARHRGIVGLLRLTHELHGEHYDAVIDLHGVLRSWVIDLFFRLRGSVICTLNKDYKRMNHRGKNRPTRVEPLVENYANVFRQAGFESGITFRTLQINDNNPQTRSGIGVAPFARFPAKIYPLHLMRCVVERLATKEHPVFLFGGRGEEAKTLDAWARDIPYCTSVAGRFTLVEEMKIMSRLALMISMDSSNQHLAALVGTRVLTIWGGTTYECGCFAFRQSATDAVCLHLPCQPCSVSGRKKCRMKDLRCMRGIPPEMIYNKAIEILNQI